MDIKNPFGELLRRRRSELGISLRKFAAAGKYDPAYISRLERGIAPPPGSKRVLRDLAANLEIEPSSELEREFLDLAAIQSRRIPEDLAESLVAKLPLLFRTLRNRKVDDKLLNDLIRKVTDDHTPKEG